MTGAALAWTAQGPPIAACPSVTGVCTAELPSPHFAVAYAPLTAAAGYYSRYAALRSLLLQFLALGLSRPAKDTPSGAFQSQQGAAGPKDSAADQVPQPAQQLEAGSRKPEPQSQQQQQAQQRQAAPGKRQVLVLGAGYDTTFFQLAKEGVQADKYVELDFKQASRQTQVTAQRQLLADRLPCHL